MLKLLDPIDRWTIFEEELSHIRDVSLLDLTKTCFQEAPDYFWTIASSVTGKYHSKDEHGPGGLVHHTKKVVLFGLQLIQGMELDDNGDEVVVACLLHDIVKYGPQTGVDTDPSRAWFKDHAFKGADFVDTICKTKLNASYNEDTKFVEKKERILRGIKAHNGRWTPREHDRPKTRFELAIHLADFMASRQFMSMPEFKGESIHTAMWKEK